MEAIYKEQSDNSYSRRETIRMKRLGKWIFPMVLCMFFIFILGVSNSSAESLTEEQIYFRDHVSFSVPSTVKYGQGLTLSMFVPTGSNAPTSSYKSNNGYFYIDYFTEESGYTSQSHCGSEGNLFFDSGSCKVDQISSSQYDIFSDISRYLNPGKHKVVIENKADGSTGTLIFKKEYIFTVLNTQRPSAPSLQVSSEPCPINNISFTLSDSNVEAVEFEAYNVTNSMGTWDWTERNGMVQRVGDQIIIDATGYPTGTWNLYFIAKVDGVWTDTITYTVETTGSLTEEQIYFRDHVSFSVPSTVKYGQGLTLSMFVPTGSNAPTSSYKSNNGYFYIDYFTEESGYTSQSHCGSEGNLFFDSGSCKVDQISSSQYDIFSDISRYLNPGKHKVVIENKADGSTGTLIFKKEYIFTVLNTQRPSAPSLQVSSEPCPINNISFTLSDSNVEAVEFEAYNVTNSMGTWDWTERNGMVQRVGDQIIIDATGYPTGTWNLYFIAKVDGVWTDTITYTVETTDYNNTTGGTDGNITWTLDGDGVLIISGTGEMNDYETENVNDTWITTAPWGSDVTSVVINDGVTGIGNSAFFECHGLTSITIPESVTSIGDYAFFECRGLTSITIPDSVTSIGHDAFSLCTGLTSITIPEGVVSIGYYAFEDCCSLTNVILPDSVTWIGSGAFNGCNALTDVYYTGTEEEWNQIDIGLHNEPLDTAAIHYNTISGTDGNIDWTLTDSGVLTVSGTGNMGDYAYNGAPWYEQRNQITEIVVNNGVNSIGKNAFYECRNLTSITIPGSVSSIGQSAFVNCSSLTSVTLPNSIISIGWGAFNGCTSLTSVTIPDGLTNLGHFAFANCSSLMSINASSSNMNYSSVGGVLFDKNETTIIAYPGGLTGEYAIPYGVTSIGDNAFWNCTLENVTIPDSVVSIGVDAFCSCSNLTSITIPNSVTYIDIYAFESCRNLANINVDSGNTYFASVEGVLFNKNKTVLIAYPGGKAGEYTIPNNVTSISAGAFANCTNLTKVTIPNSVTNIEQETPLLLDAHAFWMVLTLEVTVKLLNLPTILRDRKQATY